MADVEVIIVQEDKRYGKFGQKKRVKRGYAQNFLIPNEIAIYANAENVTKLNALEKKNQKIIEERIAAANEIKKSIDGKVITFEMKAREEGKLFGSVKPKQVVDALATEFKVEIANDRVNFQPIKRAGEQKVDVEIYDEITASITVNVIAIVDEAAAAAMAEIEDDADNDDDIVVADAIVGEAITDDVVAADVAADVSPEVNEETEEQPA
jgi:large subunit ribosomal protein L9